jgi:GNAT superfamily N-acetyltransferase
VGRFEFIEILLDHSKFSPIEVLDFDPDTSIYKDLFDKEEFSAGVLRRLGQAKDKSECHLNVLLVERFELLPKARGTGLAPRALEHLIQKLGRNSRIAALIPYPLQFSIGDTGDAFSKRMKYDEIAGDVESGERKLRKFYGKVGFVRVPGTDLMIRDLYA